MKTKFILSMALMMGAMTFTSCSKDDDKNNAETVFNVTETVVLISSVSLRLLTPSLVVPSFLRLRRLIYARY